MAVISGTTVVRHLSPRLVVIPVTELEVTATDMQDTLQDKEDDVLGMPWPKLRSMSGGEDLGGGTSVGFTIQYADTQVVPARTSSISTGTATTGSSTQLIDSAADFVTDGVKVGDWIINFTDQSVTEVLNVVDLNTLDIRDLSDGTDNDFDVSDAYKIWEVKDFTLSGGNHVAVDTVGATINPVYPTFGRFVTRTSSASATLQNQEELQTATFIGKEGLGVSMDSIAGTDSAIYPAGIRSMPCKTETNLGDISDVYGLKNVYVLENLTITGSHAGHPHTWFGDNPQTITITLDNACDVTGNKFQDCYVTGKLDTANELRECIVNGVTNANGFIYNSTLVGPITVSGDLSIQGNWVAPTAPDAGVIIDFNSQTVKVEISGWQGGRLVIKNMVTGSSCQMTSAGGKVTFDNTNTGGDVSLYGGIEHINNGTFDDFDDDTIFTRVNDVYLFDGNDAAKPVTVSGDGVTSSVAVVDGKTKTATPTSITRS